MIQQFLRPPRTAGEWAADAVRALGVAGVVVAALLWEPTDAGIVAFTLPGLVLPRFLGARPGFDIAFGLTLLVAAWSNVLDLYRTVVGWDIAVHVVATGVLAAMLFLWLVRLGVVDGWTGPASRRRIPMVLVTTTALAISALWEMVEWLGFTFISDEIFVAYTDTIGDMAAGGAGGLAAAVVVATVRIDRAPGPNTRAPLLYRETPQPAAETRRRDT